MPEDQPRVRQICEIPYDQADAADNMAIDATALEFGYRMEQAMWRVYGWTEPAISFGYSQRWNWIQTAFPDFDGAMVRRMTGGGIVDHRNDLTYCLTLPPQHAFHKRQATELYREIHRLVAAILLDMGYPADLAPCNKACGPAPQPGLCFEGPEPYDVILQQSGRKVAGAAMKRCQKGVLIQGSLSQRLLPGLSRKVFSEEMGAALARWLGVRREAFLGSLPLDELLAQRDRFSSVEWNQRR